VDWIDECVIEVRFLAGLRDFSFVQGFQAKSLALPDGIQHFPQG